MGVEHLRRAHERRGRQFESHRAERWPRSGDLTGVGARETKVGDEGLGLTDDPFFKPVRREKSALGSAAAVR